MTEMTVTGAAPYRAEPEGLLQSLRELTRPASGLPKAPSRLAPAIGQAGWRAALPVLRGSSSTLRDLRRSDARTLLAMMTVDEVARFITPPPSSVEGFERFITWARDQRLAGQYACFGVVPAGCEHAVGLFQLRRLEPDFSVGEWGFALGWQFWGTGIFLEGARLVLDFSFAEIGIHRLEARACVDNGRGNGALRKVGATQEGLLRRSFLRNGTHHDQLLWSILRDDWVRAKAVWGPKRGECPVRSAAYRLATARATGSRA
jgi:ribosomal-protein-alanine N-acetyltransferase